MPDGKAITIMPSLNLAPNTPKVYLMTEAKDIYYELSLQVT